MRFNMMLSHFLKVDIEIAAKMLMAIESISTRRAVLRTAAEHALSRVDYELFSLTLKTTRASEGRRGESSARKGPLR